MRHRRPTAAPQNSVVGPPATNTILPTSRFGGNNANRCQPVNTFPYNMGIYARRRLIEQGVVHRELNVSEPGSHIVHLDRKFNPNIPIKDHNFYTTTLRDNEPADKLCSIDGKYHNHVDGEGNG